MSVGKKQMFNGLVSTHCNFSAQRNRAFKDKILMLFIATTFGKIVQYLRSSKQGPLKLILKLKVDEMTRHQVFNFICRYRRTMDKL